MKDVVVGPSLTLDVGIYVKSSPLIEHMKRAPLCEHADVFRSSEPSGQSQ
jgi:hypothetical protein